MSEHPTTNGGDDRVKQAFDRLTADAASLDTAAARRRLDHPRRARWQGAGLVTAATLVLLVVVIGVAVLATRDDDPSVVAGPGATSGTDGVDPDGADDGPEPLSLDGTSWILVSGHGPGGVVPVLADWPISFRIDGDRVGGTAACNGYGGGLTVDGDRLSLTELSQTEMACLEPQVMEAEQAFLAALSSVGRYELTADSLTLSGLDVELVFGPEEPVPAAELIGQTWLLDTIIKGETAASVLGDPAVLVLDEDGTFTGGTGCRSLDGEYIVTGGQIQLTSFGAQGDCPADLQQQDSDVISVLESGFTTEVEGGRLTLTAAGGEGLSYRVADDPGAAGQDPDPADPPGEARSVPDLLDERPVGPVTVRGHLVDHRGGWILCDGVETADSLPPIVNCFGRWVTLLGVDDDLVAPLGLEAARDEGGAARFTEDPVELTGTLVDDGRFLLAGTDQAVTEPSADELTVLDAFAALAGAGGPDQLGSLGLPLADEVALGLGPTLVERRSATDLADPERWRLDAEEYRAYTGPFSALELLTRAAGADRLAYTVGPHDHCASPPAPVAPELTDLRHLSIQPTDATSCLEWFTVDLYLDDAGLVVAVTLDLWEP